MEKKAVVFLADGFEDVEAITPIDYLCRAGIKVTTVSISDNPIVTSRWGSIKLTTDHTLTSLAGFNIDFDAAIIPGGLPGADNIAASKETGILLKEMAAAGKLICAICAAPVVVLAPLGILNGKKFTCHPSQEKKTTDGIYLNDRVVTDGNLITSRAAGTSGEFAIAIINQLLDEFAGAKIAGQLFL